MNRVLERLSNVNEVRERFRLATACYLKECRNVAGQLALEYYVKKDYGNYEYMLSVFDDIAGLIESFEKGAISPEQVFK